MTIRDYFSVMTFDCDYPDRFIVCREDEEIKEYNSHENLIEHFGDATLKGVNVRYIEVLSSDFEYFEYETYPDSSLCFYIYI